MGQFMQQKFSSLIEDVLGVLEIDASSKAVRQLEMYAVEIVRWNRRINLTGASGVEEFISGPLFDALTLMPVLQPAGSFVDVGSGGGLPGIPAAILKEDLCLTLVEPRKRRVVFLNHALYLLGLKAEIIEAREEELAGESWRGAVAEAVWPASEWLKRAQRLVEPGGAIYTLASKPLDEADLPQGTSVEQEIEWSRPRDGATRWSARVRRHRERL